MCLALAEMYCMSERLLPVPILPGESLLSFIRVTIDRKAEV